MTAAQVAAKWAANLGNSTTSIQAGVAAVSTAPTAAAAASVQKWQQAMQSAKTAQKFTAGLNRVSLAQWQSAMVDKGIPRIASGAAAAQPKMTSFMNDLLPYTAALSQKIKAMPKLTLNDSIARATAAITTMSQFKRSS